MGAGNPGISGSRQPSRAAADVCQRSQGGVHPVPAGSATLAHPEPLVTNGSIETPHITFGELSSRVDRRHRKSPRAVFQNAKVARRGSRGCGLAWHSSAEVSRSRFRRANFCGVSLEPLAPNGAKHTSPTEPARARWAPVGVDMEPGCAPAFQKYSRWWAPWSTASEGTIPSCRLCLRSWGIGWKERAPFFPANPPGIRDAHRVAATGPGERVRGRPLACRHRGVVRNGPDGENGLRSFQRVHHRRKRAGGGDRASPRAWPHAGRCWEGAGPDTLTRTGGHQKLQNLILVVSLEPLESAGSKTISLGKLGPVQWWSCGTEGFR